MVAAMSRAISTPVQDWAEDLDEAADILANVLAPFFKHHTRTAKTNAMPPWGHHILLIQSNAQPSNA